LKGYKSTVKSYSRFVGGLHMWIWEQSLYLFRKQEHVQPISLRPARLQRHKSARLSSASTLTVYRTFTWPVHVNPNPTNFNNKLHNVKYKIQCMQLEKA
jgi:hypothetical protein